MNWKVQLFKLNYDAREAEAVASVLESEWLTMGERTVAFERAFADYLGHQTEAVAVSNGTAALHLALLALDIGPGDEVIIPSLTFVADINVVIIAGATPVLADCRSLTDWNIDPDDIERKITDKTKAVMVVHYAGIPCDMRRIVELCRKHDLRLIEECAHAPGAKFAGQSVGIFGDLGCFSFFSNKNLSVGEGGMVTSTDPSLIQDVRFLRSHGMTALTLERHQGRAISYDVNRAGLNYRTDEIHAALGLVQRSKLDAANRQRDAIVRVRPGLSGIGSIVFRDEEELMQEVDDRWKLFEQQIAPYKRLVEEWYVANQGLATYFKAILVTLWVFVFSSSGIIARAFPGLPSPPVAIGGFGERLQV